MKFKFLKSIKNVKGFTLIELLVVIGILGILAAALIATIDPFEQLKKGRDTTTRNTAIEYLNALTRYYATHGKFPWEVAEVMGAGCASPSTAVTLGAVSLAGCTAALESEGELKTGFATAISQSGAAASIKIYSTGGSAVALCFSPTAKSMKADGATIYAPACDETSLGGVGQACETSALRVATADGTCWQRFR
ncbi:MAG: type II secretion system protein [Candidatus Levybacteria bacterium]|nr:type II secretion system protein [Candidatus Levybacteria bacterium]